MPNEKGNSESVELDESVQIKKAKTSDDTKNAVVAALQKEADAIKEYEKPLDLSDSDFSQTVPFSNDVVDDDGGEDGIDITMAPDSKPAPKAVPVDPSTIKQSGRNGIEIESDLKRALYAGKSAFQIVAAQSGYTAKISPLVNSDFVDLYNSSLSLYDSRKLILNIIHEKIIETSAGDMSFNDWLANTSVGDLETFYYGVYCSTFGDDGIASIECPHCHKTIQFPLSCRNLVKTADKEKMQARLSDVSKNANSAADMKKYSLLSEKKSYRLPKSGLIVELKMPSLYDMLVFLKSTPEAIAESKLSDPEYISTVLSIGKVLVPQKAPGGEILYSEITESEKISRILDQMDIDDANALSDITNDTFENYHITYSVKNVACPECHNEIGDIPVNIERILFTLIFRKASR